MTVTWANGAATPDDWFTAKNWIRSPAGYPVAGDNIRIGDITANASRDGEVQISSGNAYGAGLYLGYATGTTGSLTITNGASITLTASSSVGNATGAKGTLIVNDGSSFSNVTSSAGSPAGSTGIVSISGPGTTWASSSLFNIGQYGTGELTVADGATLTAAGLQIGYGSGTQTNGNGTVIIDGPGTTVTTTNRSSYGASVGGFGTGALTVSGGAKLDTYLVYVGDNATGNGTVKVTGPGSELNIMKYFGVGGNGTASVTISDGGVINSGTSLGYLYPEYEANQVAAAADSTASVVVTGPGSRWNVGGYLMLANGVSQLTISDGGTVAIDPNHLAPADSAYGGTYVGYDLYGKNPDGTGQPARANVTVTGAGSLLSAGLFLNVGDSINGSLQVLNGGLVTSDEGAIGVNRFGNPQTQGSVLVSGVGSAWNIGAGGLSVGVQPNSIGTLTIAQDGAVSVSSPDGVLIAQELGSKGSIIIGAAPGQPAEAPGTLIAKSVTFGNGDGSLVFNHTDESGRYIFAPSIGCLNTSCGNAAVSLLSGTTVFTGDSTYTTATGTTISPGATLMLGDGGTTGSIVDNVVDNGELVFNRNDRLNYGGVISGSSEVHQVGAGVTSLTGDSGSFSGATSVTGGALLVNGTLGNATSTLTVSSGGILGGSGTIGGSVTIADGNLNPGNASFGGSIDTLTIGGDLTLSADSVLNYHFGEAGVVGGTLNDLVVVHGDLTLNGTLNVTPSAVGGLDPGVYRVISYDGSLTDGGLILSPLARTSFSILTSIKGQVDLVNSLSSANLDFWDGDADPNKGNGLVDGGNGTWRVAASDTNWTNSGGDLNGQYQNGSFAIFTGSAGTVTIDNSGDAPVVSGGMQFATSGYLIQGGEITLAGDSNIIRVGDGTRSGTVYVATIASELVGPGGIDKSDAGTLVLTGANTYEGGTTITSGTLQLGDGGTTGSIVGDVLNNGI
ncbi:MAG: autotransporter-associated beta strand repeat-containing protein, partial [Desulfobulbus sp.]|nr:autotransporter-associated beta strand repeat-containing protein [Desulfobulbus sp.]